MRKKSKVQTSTNVLFDVEATRQVIKPENEVVVKKEVVRLDLENLGFNSCYKDFGNYIKNRGNKTL